MTTSTQLPPRARRGMALAVAIFAIVVIGAVIAGVFFSSTQDYRIGRNSLVQQRAFTAAEHGLAYVADQWDGSIFNQPQGGTLSWNNVATGDGAVAHVRLSKLNDSLFWVASRGVVGTGTPMATSRTTNAVYRVDIPMMQFLAALTVRGNTQIGGSSYINGNDNNPPGWACDALQPAKPGIAIANVNSISTSGCNNYSCVDGNPKVQATPAAADTNTYFDYGASSDWNTLKAAADITIPDDRNIKVEPVVANGSCDKSRITNWGEPNHTTGILTAACQNYYPIIYAADDLTINGNRGQGVLLVEGDLQVQGSFEFFGPVIVRGRVKTTGTGGHFNGGVMAANVDLEQNQVLGNAVISYSNCAIQTALRSATPPSIVPQRAWAELF